MSDMIVPNDTWLCSPHFLLKVISIDIIPAKLSMLMQKYKNNTLKSWLHGWVAVRVDLKSCTTVTPQL